MHSVLSAYLGKTALELKQLIQESNQIGSRDIMGSGATDVTRVHPRLGRGEPSSLW